MNRNQEESCRVRDLSPQAFGKTLSGSGIGLRIGPFNARLRSEISSLISPLHELYKDYPIIGSDAVYSFHARLQPRRAFPRLYRRTVRFTVDGRRPHEDMPLEQSLPVVEWGLNLVIALRSHCFLMLHSAVLERNGRALLLPAMPGHGKTTLCAGLSHRGWRTLSDEFGLVRPGTRAMIPVPRPMALKNESVGVIRDFAPDAWIGPPTPNTRKGTVAHLRPATESIMRQEESAPATMVVFPRWVPGARLSLSSVTPGESFMLLATNAFNYELLGEAAFLTIRDLVAGVDAYRLEYSDLEEATTCLNELVDSYDR